MSYTNIIVQQIIAMNAYKNGTISAKKYFELLNSFEEDIYVMDNLYASSHFNEIIKQHL